MPRPNILQRAVKKVKDYAADYHEYTESEMDKRSEQAGRHEWFKHASKNLGSARKQAVAMRLPKLNKKP